MEALPVGIFAYTTLAYRVKRIDNIIKMYHQKIKTVSVEEANNQFRPILKLVEMTLTLLSVL